MDARTSPLSVPQIMAVVEHLSLPELEEVARRVLALRAARRAPPRKPIRSRPSRFTKRW